MAFVVTCPPAARPVTIEAAYFRQLGPECTGTMRVFGPPEHPVERSGPEMASLELFRDRCVIEIPSAVATRP